MHEETHAIFAKSDTFENEDRVLRATDGTCVVAPITRCHIIGVTSMTTQNQQQLRAEHSRKPCTY